MKKLIQGLVDFRRHTLPAYRLTFAKLAKSQNPDCLFIACADSRVVPNLFASTNPGDLFVVRNVGNLVPKHADASRDQSVSSALEFSVLALGVDDIVVCGHSNCGAMKGLLGGQLPEGAATLGGWLAHGKSSLDRMAREHDDGDLPEYDRLSRANVLEQVDHLRSFPFVHERLAAGTLRLHGWWFDVGSADVYAHEPDLGWVLIDEEEGARILGEPVE
jgi:carbonic anhydrase